MKNWALLKILWLAAAIFLLEKSPPHR